MDFALRGGARQGPPWHRCRVCPLPGSSTAPSLFTPQSVTQQRPRGGTGSCPVQSCPVRSRCCFGAEPLASRRAGTLTPCLCQTYPIFRGGAELESVPMALLCHRQGAGTPEPWLCRPAPGLAGVASREVVCPMAGCLGIWGFRMCPWSLKHHQNRSFSPGRGRRRVSAAHQRHSREPGQAVPLPMASQAPT